MHKEPRAKDFMKISNLLNETIICDYGVESERRTRDMQRDHALALNRFMKHKINPLIELLPLSMTPCCARSRSLTRAGRPE
jgi:hypothetical protein